MSINPEYLRRNLLVCKAFGANANAKAALKRLRSHKNAPKWLIEALQGIVQRTHGLGPELAAYRALTPMVASEQHSDNHGVTAHCGAVGNADAQQVGAPSPNDSTGEPTK